MSAKVCGNCGGTWVDNACLDCKATLAMIAQAAEYPGGAVAEHLNGLRRDVARRGGPVIHPMPQEEL